MTVEATLNNYIDQVRFRIAESERSYRASLSALQGSQAAAGRLRSGSTIARSLKAFEEDFAKLTDALIDYLGKFEGRTSLSRDDMLSVTSTMLHQSLLVFQAITDREKLTRFGGKGLDKVIDESFARAVQRLNLKLQEFRMGLSDPTPGWVPASNRYVRLEDNQRDEILDEIRSLKQIVLGKNDVADDDREVALAEIAIFEATIVQPRVPTELVQRFVDRVISWLLTLFTGAAVSEVAQNLIQALTPLLL